jgi:pimeloyl-ACP methyl ester carboxylesterase
MNAPRWDAQQRYKSGHNLALKSRYVVAMPPTTDSTFVLLHGSCHGAWCWDSVISGLGTAGRRAVAPELSMAPGTTLNDHLAQGTAALANLDGELTLVGHSYAGILLADLAEHHPLVKSCVYLDAFVPQSNECAFDLLGPIGADLRAFAEQDPSNCFPAPPAEAFGVTDASVAAILADRLVPMPAATHTTPVSRPALNADGSSPATHWTSTYVRCTRFPAFAVQAERAANAGWPVHELDADHEIMLSAPTMLVDVLLGR